MQTVIQSWEPPSLAVAGSAARFPVRRIYCVGRNYPEHTREMGHDPQRDAPVFFSKPADAIVAGGGRVAYPPATACLHHEVELVVALADGGSDIAPERALACVYGYAVGLDLTRRDLQQRAKEKGQPWDMGKGFDQSAPIGELQPAAHVGHPQSGAITLAVDGQLRQSGDLAQMGWPVPLIIAQLSKLVRLAAGDLIFTGTPAGVGPAERGETIVARIEGVGELTATLV